MTLVQTLFLSILHIPLCIFPTIGIDYTDHVSSGSNGISIYKGDNLYSSNNNVRLRMQGDGNFVLQTFSTSWTATGWSTKTQGNDDAFVKLETDGNLVVYISAGNPIWSTNTNIYQGIAGGPYFLVVSDDGYAYLLNRTNHKLWDTGTVPDTVPTLNPSTISSAITTNPTTNPTRTPTNPTSNPTKYPTKDPANDPTKDPTKAPTKAPTSTPTNNPSPAPTNNSTESPTNIPSMSSITVTTFSPTITKNTDDEQGVGNNMESEGNTNLFGFVINTVTLIVIACSAIAGISCIVGFCIFCVCYWNWNKKKETNDKVDITTSHRMINSVSNVDDPRNIEMATPSTDAPFIEGDGLIYTNNHSQNIQTSQPPPRRKQFDNNNNNNNNNLNVETIYNENDDEKMEELNDSDDEDVLFGMKTPQ